MKQPDEFNNYTILYNKTMRLFLSLCLVTLVICGRIYKGDVWVDYANAGSMTELSFSFML
jgi:hypothetical protein